MSIWWPFENSNSTDYIKSDYYNYNYSTTYDVPRPASTVWTLTTTTNRVNTFYHPASYSKRWKR
jgi:hypothetical protein